jgi:hypothetical protein
VQRVLVTLIVVALVGGITGQGEDEGEGEDAGAG